MKQRQSPSREEGHCGPGRGPGRGPGCGHGLSPECGPAHGPHVEPLTSLKDLR